MVPMFGDGDKGLPPLELSDDTRSPGDEYLQRQVRVWAYMAAFFALLIPWMWLYFSFAYDLRKDLPVIAAVVMHGGLALVWVGRRRSRPALTWAGVGCYPLAVALCLLLKDVL